MAHTPGPWHVMETESVRVLRTWVIDADDGTLICDAYGLTPENAALVAAAPELLDVLKAIDEWLDDTTLKEPRRSRQAIKDVIAKAEGGAS